MVIKTVNVTINVLLAMTVGAATMVLAVLFVHILVMSGYTVYHLLR